MLGCLVFALVVLALVDGFIHQRLMKSAASDAAAVSGQPLILDRKALSETVAQIAQKERDAAAVSPLLLRDPSN
jgi:hypothetical protein